MTEELREILKLLSAEVNTTSFQISSLFRSHLSMFASGVQEFDCAVGDATTKPLNDEAMEGLARRLCEMSREVVFSAPHEDVRSSKLVEGIVRLFQFSAGLMEEVERYHLEAYRSNIVSRAERFQRITPKMEELTAG